MQYNPGKITAHRDIQFTRSYERKREHTRYTDAKESSSISIIGFEIPWFPDDNTLFSFAERLIVRDTELPLGIVYKTKAKQTDTEDEIPVIYAIDAYISDYYRTFSNTNILGSSMSLHTSAKGYTISSDMSCIDFMGTKSKIYVEE